MVYMDVDGTEPSLIHFDTLLSYSSQSSFDLLSGLEKTASSSNDPGSFGSVASGGPNLRTSADAGTGDPWWDGAWIPMISHARCQHLLGASMETPKYLLMFKLSHAHLARSCWCFLYESLFWTSEAEKPPELNSVR